MFLYVFQDDAPGGDLEDDDNTCNAVLSLNGIGKILHYCILIHRFMNMCSAEFIRKFKRDEKL